MMFVFTQGRDSVQEIEDILSLAESLHIEASNSRVEGELPSHTTFFCWEEVSL